MYGIILADAALADLDTLIGRPAPDVTVIRVADDEDAIGLLSDALETGPAAVHLIAHGAPGVIRLGAAPLDTDALLDRRWPDAGGSEILIHACDVGAGAEGRRFVERLAAVTGARVAAASHPVGHPDRGGSWDLDVVSGPIAAASAFAGAGTWPHRLAYSGKATSGNDTLIGDNAGTTIDGLAGNDSIVGGTGNDSLVGGAGNDTLVGGGNGGLSAGDTMNGGLGGDHYVGGSGFNIVTYENATTGITLDLTNGANNTGEAAGDTFINIQRWIGSEYDDSLTAGDGAVWFWGHGGNDVEHGSAYDDTLEAGDGNDSVFGGGGADLIYGRADNDELHGQAGNDTVAGGGGADLIYGDVGNDLLKGDWERDTVHGGDGDDTILAGIVTAGSYTQTQSDLIYGDAGNDRYIVVSQYDGGTVSFDGGAGTDTLELRSDTLTSINGYNLEYYTDVASPKIDISGMTLTGVETLALTGSQRHGVTMTAAQADGFAGITGAATGDAFAIAGAALSGTVGSGTGGTLLAGQVQAETVNGVTLVHIGLDGSAGADTTLRIAGSFAASDIHLSGNTISLGQAGPGGSTGGGTGGGDTGGQTLTGTDARDYLAGGSGNDTITGNAGNDYMIGGAGRDSFVQHANDGWDVIGDFQAGTGGDVVDIRSIAGFTSLNDVLTHSSQEGADLSIDFGGISSIKLMGIDRNTLTADNFLFTSSVG